VEEQKDRKLKGIQRNVMGKEKRTQKREKIKSEKKVTKISKHFRPELV
jgi:hypothetical protein